MYNRNRSPHHAGGGSGGSGGGGGGMSGSAYLEQENDSLVDGLSGKVNALKSIGLHIGNEVRDQNRLLGELDSDFDASQGLLGSTMRRLGIVSKSGGNRLVCYLAAFAFLVFLIIYWLYSSRS